MQLQDKLVELRAKAFQKIGAAARSGQTVEVNRLGQIAKACEDTMEALKNIESEIVRIVDELDRDEQKLSVGYASALKGAPLGHGDDASSKAKASPRKRANEVRTMYVAGLSDRHGIVLHRRREISYETQSGMSVGIPFATESRTLPDRWWLGLPDERFDFIVLLCETKDGELLDFVFPPPFVSEIWSSLSRDDHRHVKINVFRRGADFELQGLGGVIFKIRRFMGHGENLSS